ncbi:hypothetical protein THRCLA_20588 [Thraustotheca clavata]|uniref:Uncharacterized protein n=1 Tax=Thraustotheca clavata TaxID=74557 RepID=A0A1W0A5Q5_9STRA|nr:hypothetical protein THRCLA_20588 [Thraustotheca clavata]
MQRIKQFISRWCGPVHIILSIICSLVYIEMIEDSISNDLFWPNMSPTGAQMYLIELFSRHVVMKKEMTIDLFDPSSAIIDKFILHLHHTVFGLRIHAIFEYTSIRDTITGFRSFDASYTFNLFTQYCWVDFDRRWEIAHTFKRQKR